MENCNQITSFTSILVLGESVKSENQYKTVTPMFYTYTLHRIVCGVLAGIKTHACAHTHKEERKNERNITRRDRSKSLTDSVINQKERKKEI